MHFTFHFCSNCSFKPCYVLIFSCSFFLMLPSAGIATSITVTVLCFSSTTSTLSGQLASDLLLELEVPQDVFLNHCCNSGLLDSTHLCTGTETLTSTLVLKLSLKMFSTQNVSYGEHSNLEGVALLSQTLQVSRSNNDL